jgi:putative flavoprotein involved in K+ transport
VGTYRSSGIFVPVAGRDTIVIGAGPGGLAAAAMLQRQGVPTLVVERDSIAASWRGHYDRLHLHTMRWLSHLPGLRFSARHGRWVSRDGVVRYLEHYAAHHGLKIACGVEVDRITRAVAGTGWTLESKSGGLPARCAVVATGYNREPVWPDWPGRQSFSGTLVHGAEYRNPGPYKGQDVLVVGGGNTAAEIVVDLVEGGVGRVRLSIRTPPNVVLREVNGMPAQVTGVLMRRFPTALADRITAVAQRLAIGDLAAYGLEPAPRGTFTQAKRDDVTPILDVGLIDCLKAGRVEIVAAVESFDGSAAVLADGSRIHPDAVIACPGWRRALEPLVGHLGLLDGRGRPVVHGAKTHPRALDLHFIGFTNPISGMFREFGFDARKIARHQARRFRAAGRISIGPRSAHVLQAAVPAHLGASNANGLGPDESEDVELVIDPAAGRGEGL